MSETVSVAYRSLGELARAPRNPKAHDLPALKASIRRHGFVLPVVEDARTKLLVAGHGRLQALLEMQQDGEAAPKRILVKNGSWQVPVIEGVAFADEREAESFLLADNRLVESGGWDHDALNAILADLRDAEALDGVGWTPQEIDLLLTTNDEEVVRGQTPEEAAEIYNAGVIKQIVLYFKDAEYADVLSRLDKVMEQAGVDNHTSAFLYLLSQHEQAGSPTQ